MSFDNCPSIVLQFGDRYYNLNKPEMVVLMLQTQVNTVRSNISCAVRLIKKLLIPIPMQ
jgi:hypothetical protein